MSGQRQHFFHRRNLAIGKRHDPLVDPVDGIAPRGNTGSHYSFNKQLRHPGGPNTRDDTDAYHEDAAEMKHLEGQNQSALTFETDRVGQRRTEKQKRFARKDGLDKKAHKRLLKPAVDAERTQEMPASCLSHHLLWQTHGHLAI